MSKVRTYHIGTAAKKMIEDDTKEFYAEGAEHLILKRLGRTVYGYNTSTHSEFNTPFEYKWVEKQNTLPYLSFQELMRQYDKPTYFLAHHPLLRKYGPASDTVYRLRWFLALIMDRFTEEQIVDILSNTSFVIN